MLIFSDHKSINKLTVKLSHVFFPSGNCQNLLSLKNLKWGYHCSLNIYCLFIGHSSSQSVHQHAVLRVCKNLVCNIVAGVFSLNWLHCLEKKKLCVSEASHVSPFR